MSDFNKMWTAVAVATALLIAGLFMVATAPAAGLIPTREFSPEPQPIRSVFCHAPEQIETFFFIVQKADKRTEDIIQSALEEINAVAKKAGFDGTACGFSVLMVQNIKAFSPAVIEHDEWVAPYEGEAIAVAPSPGIMIPIEPTKVYFLVTLERVGGA